MMTSRDAARYKRNDDSSKGKLLNEIESISKALYLDKNPSKSSSSAARSLPKSVDKSNVFSKHGGDGPSTKEKKSFWNWKPLKALSHVRNRRFNCCFSLKVHTIEGLPSKFNDINICVHWKRRDGEVVTSPIKVVEGSAEFEEKLTHTCSVYGSRSGPHHSAKYEAKHFLLYAAVHGNPLDLGKQRVDLTRLLPLTLEELEDEKSSGTWTTSFKLSGEAKGAVMNVSFEYLVLGDGIAPNNKNVLKLLDSKSTARNYIKSNQGDDSFQENMVNSEDTEFSFIEKGTESLEEKSTLVEDGGKIVDHQDLKSSDLSVVYTDTGVSCQEKAEFKRDEIVIHDCHSAEKVVDHQDVTSSDLSVAYSDAGISCQEEAEFKRDEIATHDCYSAEKVVEHEDESSNLIVACSDAGISCQEEAEFKRDEIVVHDFHSSEKKVCIKESLLEDLESILSNVAELEKEGLDTPETNSESSDQENENEDKNMMMPSLSLDDVADTVADEFLSMLDLNTEADPESPRERLLREFEKEAEASGCSLFGFDIDEEDVEDYDYYAPSISGWEEFDEDPEFLAVDQNEYPKIRAKVMEDLETQELMQEWGLDEMAFQSSPPNSRGGFGSPIDLPPKESLQLPSLGEGLGPFIQTPTGGFLRSMNPSHFANAKSGGSLIMQVSSPVVVPAELGSGVMDILQHLASMGLEKLSMQANKLMPLEDITGRTMQQIAWEAAPHVEASESQNLLQDETEDGSVTSAGKKRIKETSSGRKSKKISSSLSSDEADSEYVSLEDLAPLAMDKIEALSIEGLRIQSGMSEEEAPSNINAQSIGEFSTLEGKKITSTASMGLEGAAGLQLLDVKDSGIDGDDGLMGLSLTLDEWMKLDSGEIDEDEILSERTSKLLAAHHAKSTDLNFLGRKGERKGKGSGRRCGLLGNNFTVALMVQLRDPLRNYEPVGTPILALIQVERVFVPPKPKIYSTVSEAKDNSDEDDLESVAKEEKQLEPEEEKTQEHDKIPQYKISEVHVSGLKTEPGKKKLWGNSAQQQSGSRWLLANGMGKGKNLFGKPKIATKSSLPATVASQPGDTLWSISAKFNGSGSKWKQLASLNPHIRNPNVILSNETIKLR
ncbi:protein PLASTID MOVEMENT IMPAIRED 1-RELATED 1 isoform X2 [Spinacia oleracea]|uniref:Protein PLASTID MOVEMENT IMPAIRED 1-RELATED 1 isoform X2 n=1 Tax=Spinacia oleracea TaxID=3562 RepID=A0ABM3RVY3_SPIOL|nr:protein PLASTID MOVEMENT IMPAIRED 1-RELATED 1 isoform X2 [Spinacia oleracea]